MFVCKKIWIFAFALLAVISGCEKKQSPPPFHNIEGTYPCHGQIGFHNDYKTPTDSISYVNTTFSIKVKDDRTIECASPYDSFGVNYFTDDGTILTFYSEQHTTTNYQVKITYDYISKTIEYAHSHAKYAAAPHQEYSAIFFYYP